MAILKFYSLKSKKEVYVEISNITIKTMKNGRKAAEAVDPETGSKLFKFLSKDDLLKVRETKSDDELPDGGTVILGKD